ncbi:MAG: hypothetical protein HGA35_07085, partial [Erysipelotrichaceae bacterium]|nr:hypothetical protein [Erysipelotrichaceae bacterium]
NLNVKAENLRLREHELEELSHYSKGTADVEYKFPWGFDEIWGIADRTDFDLKQHQIHSGSNMEYLDPTTNEKYIPYCVEPAVGVERLFLTFLTDSYEEQELEKIVLLGHSMGGFIAQEYTFKNSGKINKLIFNKIIRANSIVSVFCLYLS